MITFHKPAAELTDDFHPAHLPEYVAGAVARRLLGQDAPARTPGYGGPKLANIKAVQNAFANQEAGHVEHLVSDGVSLWSYGWWEVARWVNGVCILRKGTSYSTTTASKHRSGLSWVIRDMIDASEETPRGSGSMQL